jgi:hypothetical protein
MCHPSAKQFNQQNHLQVIDLSPHSEMTKEYLENQWLISS